MIDALAGRQPSFRWARLPEIDSIEILHTRVLSRTPGANSHVSTVVPERNRRQIRLARNGKGQAANITAANDPVDLLAECYFSIGPSHRSLSA